MSKRILSGGIVLSCLLAVGSVFAPSPLPAQQPPPAAAEPAPDAEPAPSIDRWIEMLADEDFSQREWASGQLLQSGLLAEEALKKASHSPDREVRYRSTHILAEIYQSQRHRQMEDFLAAKPGSEQNLPGWEGFHVLVGDTPEIRRLFVAMLDEEWEMLGAIQQSPPAAVAAFSKRMTELQESMRYQPDIPLGTIAALLYVVADPKNDIPETSSAQLYNLCYQRSFQQAFEEGRRTGPLRTMLGNWISRGGSSWDAYQCLTLAMRYELEEGIKPAERILNGGRTLEEGPADKDQIEAAQISPHVVQYAALAVAKLGSREKHVPLLRKLRDREDLCSSMTVNNVQYDTQVRDIALAAEIHLYGQDPRQYGFDQIRDHSQMLFSPGTIGFKNDDDRKAAMTKWQQYLDRQQEKQDPQDPQAQAVPQPAEKESP